MHWLEPYIATYGAIAVFFVIYCESFGVPLPGESLVIGASLLAQHDSISGEGLSLIALLIAVFSGAILGDSTGYMIGHYGGRKVLVRYGPRVKLSPERLTHIEGLFERYGMLVVILARFVVPLRQLNGILAGSVAMKWPKFLLANILGAALWTAVWGAGPYYFSSFFRQLF